MDFGSGEWREGTSPSRSLRTCGCRKLCRGWSGGISVLVDESATAGRSNDLEVSIWLVCRVGGDGAPEACDSYVVTDIKYESSLNIGGVISKSSESPKNSADP